MLSDEGVLKSMLHLNPYYVMMNDHRMEIDYIVGVATDENYRHRKAMTCLLKQTFRDAYAEKKPFVYLMPADEAIYRPFQFAYIYDQLVECKNPVISEKTCDDVSDITAVGATCENDYTMITEMANSWLAEKYDLYTWRDQHYFKRLQLENQADGGDLLFLYEKETCIGYLSYAKETVAEVREIWCQKRCREAVAAWLIQYFQGIKVELLPTDPNGILTSVHAGEKIMRPIIMGRIVHLTEWMLKMPVGKVPYALNIEVTDQYIAENNGLWHWQVSDGKMDWHPTSESEDLTVTVDGLLQWLTGYCSVNELEKSGQIVLKSHCREILDQIPVLKGIFINEIV
jgi:predicted acetyltransferase